MAFLTRPWTAIKSAVGPLLSLLPFWNRPDDPALQKIADLKASEVLCQIQNDRFSDLRQQFFLPLRWMLTESMLRKGWAIIGMTAGPIVKVGDPIVKTGWLTTAIIPIQFKRAKLAMSLSFTSSGSIVGLRFGPQRIAGLGNSWKTPDYADSSDFRETDVLLGSKHKVGGTLTLPKLPGPCDRDATLEAAKPFKDIAWGLAGRGVAVLRFDKVTLNHGRKFNNKTVTLKDEYMDQAIDAIRQAVQHPEIGDDQVYVLGHSLGAVVAPRLATKEDSVAGIIIMAGPAHPLYHSAIRQMKYLASMNDISSQFPNSNLEDLQRQADAADAPDLSSSTAVTSLPFGLGAPYWLDCRSFDPIGTTKNLDKPVMVLQGGRDYQVTVDDDYVKWVDGLNGKSNVQFRLYEKLNHLFIAGEGPSTPLEYDVPGNVDKSVIQDTSDWVFKNSER